jgi:hypothetical protein
MILISLKHLFRSIFYPQIFWLAPSGAKDLKQGSALLIQTHTNMSPVVGVMQSQILNQLTLPGRLIRRVVRGEQKGKGYITTTSIDRLVPVT